MSVFCYGLSAWNKRDICMYVWINIWTRTYQSHYVRSLHWSLMYTLTLPGGLTQLIIQGLVGKWSMGLHRILSLYDSPISAKLKVCDRQWPPIGDSCLTIHVEFEGWHMPRYRLLIPTLDFMHITRVCKFQQLARHIVMYFKIYSFVSCSGFHKFVVNFVDFNQQTYRQNRLRKPGAK